jgi:mannose-6-phosphate isomerase-like protein (cupin superfamily)
MIEQNLVGKSWGWERWFVNNSLYCGKELFVRCGDWSSKGKYHYHKVKDETFYVIEGTLALEYYEGNEHKRITLSPSNSFRIPPGMKHRFTALTSEGCKFIEVSTMHSDLDSYRCELINGEWVEDISKMRKDFDNEDSSVGC